MRGGAIERERMAKWSEKGRKGRSHERESRNRKMISVWCPHEDGDQYR